MKILLPFITQDMYLQKPERVHSPQTLMKSCFYLLHHLHSSFQNHISFIYSTTILPFSGRVLYLQKTECIHTPPTLMKLCFRLHHHLHSSFQSRSASLSTTTMLSFINRFLCLNLLPQQPCCHFHQLYVVCTKNGAGGGNNQRGGT